MPSDGCAMAAAPISIMDAARINENTFFIIKMNINCSTFKQWQRYQKLIHYSKISLKYNHAVNYFIQKITSKISFGNIDEASPNGKKVREELGVGVPCVAGDEITENSRIDAPV